MKRADVVRLLIVGFKFLSGGLELLSGLALAVLPPGVLQTIVDLLVREEVREDPHDPAVSFIQSHLEGFLDQRRGVAAGLVVLGTIKIVGAYGLLRRRAWGYYVLVSVLVALLAVEAIHLRDSRSGTSLLVTAANAVVLGLLLIFRQRFVEHQMGNVQKSDT